MKNYNFFSFFFAVFAFKILNFSSPAEDFWKFWWKEANTIVTQQIKYLYFKLF